MQQYTVWTFRGSGWVLERMHALHCKYQKYFKNIVKSVHMYLYLIVPYVRFV